MTLHRTRALVLDSWAVLAFLEDEPAGSTVADLIADAQEQGIPILMTVVNAGEVWYIIARKTAENEADDNLNRLRELGVRIIDVDWKLARGAARYKSKYKMSYADGFAATLASLEKGSLITGDKEFRQVEGEIKILWLA